MSVTEAPGATLDTAIAELLTQAYWMEIETVTNYIAASIGHDGGRSREIKTALARGVEEEVEHARQVGRRIQELYGVVAGAGALTTEPEHPAVLARDADIETMIEAVVAAETGAIRHYAKISRATAELDRATNAMAIEILRDEQRHLRLFEHYRREFRVAH